jgi:hypothetical protein
MHQIKKAMQIVRNRYVIGVLIASLIFILGYSIMSRYSNSFSVRMSKTTVIKELRELNRLETASFTIEKVVDAGTTGNQFQEILFGDRILLIASGQVIAGVDLSKLRASDVTVEDKTLRLVLPAPEILVTTLNNEDTRVYDRRLGLLNRGDSGLESRARVEAEEAIRKAACEGRILSEAAKNARNQLTALFKAMQFTTVIIDIPQASC